MFKIGWAGTNLNQPSHQSMGRKFTSKTICTDMYNVIFDWKASSFLFGLLQSAPNFVKFGNNDAIDMLLYGPKCTVHVLLQLPDYSV